MSNDIYSFIPSLGYLFLVLGLTVVGALILGLLRSAFKGSTNKVLFYYEENEPKIRSAGVFIILFIVGLMFALGSPFISTDFELNLYAVLVFGLMFIMIAFLYVAVRIR